MLIILLFFPLIFFENSFDKIAGALRFVEIWFSQLLELKFSSLSFSNKDALLIKQSNPFRVLKALQEGSLLWAVHKDYVLWAGKKTKNV